MSILEKFLGEAAVECSLILDPDIPLTRYTPIDLSIGNTALNDLDLSKPVVCQKYIDQILLEKNAVVAYGGYLEKRNLYKSYNAFQKASDDPRTIHLGIDFWTTAGTSVCAPLEGKVHSFKNNRNIGDYGPTVLLEHIVFDRTFYTLYGHLSISSLHQLYTGKSVASGECFASLGTPDINVNYAPHLHFQLIDTLNGHFGDYPGVCNTTDLPFYAKNCPNPALLLKV